jgi:RNA polymerase sigma-70 factor, ECF subfamily
MFQSTVVIILRMAPSGPAPPQPSQLSDFHLHLEGRWRVGEQSLIFPRGDDQFSTTEQLEEHYVYSLGQQPPNEPEAISPQSHDDAALIAAVLRKDRKATAEFVARYSDHVYGYVRARLAPRYEQIEDLVQEIFLSAWENLVRYRGDGSLQAWVMGIARHKVEDYYRQRLRAPEPLDEAREDSSLLAFNPQIDQLLDQRDLRQKAWRVLAEIPEEYRLALVWRYWDEASARDMAFKTGKTEKAIERLLARARAQFRERWNHGQ